VGKKNKKAGKPFELRGVFLWGRPFWVLSCSLVGRRSGGNTSEKVGDWQRPPTLGKKKETNSVRGKEKGWGKGNVPSQAGNAQKSAGIGS